MTPLVKEPKNSESEARAQKQAIQTSCVIKQQFINQKKEAMPIDPSAIAATAGNAGQGAMQTIGNFMNMGFTLLTNRQQRKFSEKMYSRQRADALEDFAMQNEYNHPSNQMARLRQAGLNPALVYDKGSGIQNAAPIRGSEPKSINPSAPRFDMPTLGNPYMAIMDAKVKEAQVDNLRSQITVQDQDKLLKQAQTFATLRQGEKTQFDTMMANQLKEFNLEAAKLDNEKRSADIAFTLDSNERARLQSAQSLAKGVEEILTMRVNREFTGTQKDQMLQAIKNLKLDEVLKQYEIDLNKKGIQKGDPAYYRLGAKAVDAIGDALPYKIGFKGKGLGKPSFLSAPMDPLGWLVNPRK